MEKSILVYHNQLLPISEMFIYNQSVKLRNYVAYFLGAKQQKGPRIVLPEDRQYVINPSNYTGRVRETLFKLFGYVPTGVRKWVSDFNPRLVHAHFGFDGAIALPLAKQMNLPLVVSFLGTDATLKDEYAKKGYIIQRLYLLRRLKLIERTTRVIVPSIYLKRKVMEQGFPSEKISLIYHGVDLSECLPSSEPPDSDSILFVGRLIRRKGLPFLIDAIHQIREQFPNACLTVIGDGPERSNYESLAAKSLGNNVKFLGSQPHHVVREHMARAYVFSMPSITEPSGEVETFGLVFAEAQAFGVPVVSFNSGASAEVITHEKTGFLAEEKNTQELAHYLRMLFENPNLRNRMGLAAREKVEEQFDLKVQNRKLENLYDEVSASYTQ